MAPWLRYAAVAALSAAATWYGPAHVQKSRMEARISETRATTAERQATETAESLTALEASVRGIRAAADGYRAQQLALAPKLDTILTELRNAPRPLPADCRPDDFRVRQLGAAVDAANAAGADSTPR